MRQPLYEQGRQAVELILAQIAGEQVCKEVIMPTELVTCRSCGCFSEMAMQAVVEVGASAGAGLDKGTALVQALVKQPRTDSNRVQINPLPALHGAWVGWLPELFDAFLADLSVDAANQPGKGLFLSLLERLLNESAQAGSNVIEWQNVISRLRQLVLPFVDGRNCRFAPKYLEPVSRDHWGNCRAHSIHPTA